MLPVLHAMLFLCPVVIRNPATRLIDLYKASRKRAGAATAAAGTKRAAGTAPEERGSKRQQQTTKGEEALVQVPYCKHTCTALGLVHCTTCPEAHGSSRDSEVAHVRL